MFEGLTTAPSREQVVALAGIFLACGQVDSYARLGTGNSRDLETAIHGLLSQNPESTEAVFRGVADLENGFATMERVLGNPKDPNNTLILRYVLGVLYLSRKLSRNRRMLKQVGDGIARAGAQSELFSLTHTNVIANIADLYQRTVSTFNFRIQVNGVAAYLQQPAIANRIRCLLFSAVRAAILWQQVGGSRVHLMLRRDRVLTIARELHREARRQAIEEHRDH